MFFAKGKLKGMRNHSSLWHHLIKAARTRSTTPFQKHCGGTNHHAEEPIIRIVQSIPCYLLTDPSTALSLFKYPSPQVSIPPVRINTHFWTQWDQDRPVGPALAPHPPPPQARASPPHPRASLPRPAPSADPAPSPYVFLPLPVRSRPALSSRTIPQPSTLISQ